MIVSTIKSSRGHGAGTRTFSSCHCGHRSARHSAILKSCNIWRLFSSPVAHPPQNLLHQLFRGCHNGAFGKRSFCRRYQVTPAIFDRFVDFRGLSSKIPCFFAGRMQYQNFRHFSSKPPGFGRVQNDRFQNGRFDNPELSVCFLRKALLNSHVWRHFLCIP